MPIQDDKETSQSAQNTPRQMKKISISRSLSAQDILKDTTKEEKPLAHSKSAQDSLKDAVDEKTTTPAPLSTYQKMVYLRGISYAAFGTRFGIFKPFNEIVPGLFLSSQLIRNSLINSDQMEALLATCEEKRRPLKGVTAVMSPQEFGGELAPWISVVTAKDWQERNVSVNNISSYDHGVDFTFHDVKTELDKVYGEISSGFSHLIHCKAGRGRSWVFIACYITTYPCKDDGSTFTFKEAREHIEKKRYVVSPNATQLMYVKTYIAWHQTLREIINIQHASHWQNAEQCLENMMTKNFSATQNDHKQTTGMKQYTIEKLQILHQRIIIQDKKADKENRINTQPNQAGALHTAEPRKLLQQYTMKNAHFQIPSKPGNSKNRSQEMPPHQTRGQGQMAARRLSCKVK